MNALAVLCTYSVINIREQTKGELTRIFKDTELLTLFTSVNFSSQGNVLTLH